MNTFKPGEVTLVVGGSIVKTWDKIVVSREEDEWMFSTGTGGETTRTLNQNKLGTIEIALPQASGENAVLSAHQIAGSLISCSVIDKSGKSLHAMPEGTVIKSPDAEYGKESGQRVWIIKGDLPVHVIGGN